MKIVFWLPLLAKETKMSQLQHIYYRFLELIMDFAGNLNLFTYTYVVYKTRNLFMSFCTIFSYVPKLSWYHPKIAYENNVQKDMNKFNKTRGFVLKAA